MNDPFGPAKRAAGRAAAELARSGMRLGLGTGSTVRHVLERLAEMRGDGLDIVGVPTSVDTEQRARQLGIPLAELDQVERLDLAIDGADEIDRHKTLIKGGGGALVREKIVAAAAEEFVVVASANKVVDVLGSTFRLPVEVMSFGSRHAARAIAALGLVGEFRTDAAGAPFVSDNGNNILDCTLPAGIDAAKLESDLNRIPGVVDNGLFVAMAGRILVGDADGSVRQLP